MGSGDTALSHATGTDGEIAAKFQVPGSRFGLFRFEVRRSKFYVPRSTFRVLGSAFWVLGSKSFVFFVTFVSSCLRVFVVLSPEPRIRNGYCLPIETAAIHAAPGIGTPAISW